MTQRLLKKLDPLFRELPGHKLHRVARELATLCRDDGTLTYGKVRHSVLAARAGCSEKTVQRLPKSLPPGLLEYVPGVGHAASYWRFDLVVAARLLAAVPLLLSTGTGHGSRQHDGSSRSSPRRFGATAPRGPAGWWDRKRMDHLVRDVQAVRPAWTPGGIVAAAVRALRNGATMARLRQALLAVARAGDSLYPMRVVSNGWWWHQGSVRWQADPLRDPADEEAQDPRHANPPKYDRSTAERVAARPPRPVAADGVQPGRRAGHVPQARVTPRSSSAIQADGPLVPPPPAWEQAKAELRRRNAARGHSRC